MNSLLEQAIEKIPNNSSILFGVLNWGLGHASRSAVIIQALIQSGHQVILASDGASKQFLESVFPDLESRELPSYNITYKYSSMPLNMLLQGPSIASAIAREHKVLKKWQSQEAFDFILSDNRYGLYVKGLPSILISHQFNLQADNAAMAWMANVVLKTYLIPFTDYWCPDYKDRRISGSLSMSKLNIRFIGPLSLLKNQDTEQDIDVLFLLSGPEPQRSRLEELLMEVNKNHLFPKGKKVVLIRGKMIDITIPNSTNFESKNYLIKQELSRYIQRAKFVVCRSGYSTIMDLQVLGKKAVFIPTPGQTEQEYLAKYLSIENGPYSWLAQKEVREELGELIIQCLEYGL